MTNLEVFGGAGKKKRQVRKLAEWLMYRLLREATAQQIDLQIELVPRLKAREGIYGDCNAMGCDGLTRYPRTFAIRLDANTNTHDLLETLCHEAVHVYQYATGKLEQLSRKPVYRYAGQHYPTNMRYERTPWEKEANSKSLVLLEEYLDSQNQK